MQVFGCACWKGLMALLAARDEEDWHTCRAKPLILFKPRNPLARAFFRSCCLKAFKPVGHEEKKCTLILLSIWLRAYFTDQPFWAAAFIYVSTALEETVTLQFMFASLPDGQSKIDVMEQGLGQLHSCLDGHIRSKGQSCYKTRWAFRILGEGWSLPSHSQQQKHLHGHAEAVCDSLPTSAPSSGTTNTWGRMSRRPQCNPNTGKKATLF